MSVIGSEILAGASGQSTGDYDLIRSLRLRASAGGWLGRTLSTNSTSQTKMTWSGWVKRGALGTARAVLAYHGNTAGNANMFFIEFVSDFLVVYYNGTGSSGFTTNQVFRDPSAWYHIVLAYDSTQATSSNRSKLYVNGTQVTSFSSISYPSLNQAVNNVASTIQNLGNISSLFFDGYLSEVNFIDGQALDPTSFGETSTTTRAWQPKKYDGTYGINGYYLPFTDNSSLTTSSNVGLGKDFSGNGNYFSTTNISITAGSTYDSMTDIPTLTSATQANFAVLNPINAGAATITQGNLALTSASTGWRLGYSTIAMTSGKYYCEVSNVSGNFQCGVALTSSTNFTNYLGSTSSGWGYDNGGEKYTNATSASYGASYTSSDVVGIAFDADNGTLTFYKNNTSQGTAYTGLTNTLGYYFAMSQGGGANTSNINFGQRPFAYTPPTGFVALNTFNLPTPTIGATESTQANKYMDVTTYTGNGTSQSIINSGSMQPDLVWVKERSSTSSNWLINSIAGSSQYLSSNSTNEERTDTTLITALNTNGFSVGANNGSNENAQTYVGWQWKANGTGVSNTAGSITSTVSANTSAGFSVVTYTGTAANATVGHGLGVAPSMIICKTRGSANSWQVGHTSIGWQRALYLNLTNAQSGTSSLYWNNTAPTSTVFSLGSDAGGNDTTTMVAYCFSEVAGYSKFGSYIGNGSTSGTFVYLGFKPRYILWKRTDTTSDWGVIDTARDTYNTIGYDLTPNASAAEGTGYTVDFLSNGFKIRLTATRINANGGTYIYAAFAENPFKYSLAR
jgi:hypothetical protein